MLKLSHAVVSGRLPFPLDMLRYDSCWPRYEVGSLHMNAKGFREVQITTHVKAGRRKSSLDDFTPGRWESFGWDIDPVQ